MNLLLASDHGLFREGLARILHEKLYNCRIDQGHNWKQLHRGISRGSYDLVFLDMSIIPEASFWTNELSSIRKVRPNLPICLFSSSDIETRKNVASELGVEGFLPRNFDIDNMTNTVKSLISGNIVFPRKSMNIKFSPDKRCLTNRQHEIMGYVAAGRSNRLIACDLGLSEATIKRHLSNIYKSLDVKNRLSAIHAYQRFGLCD